MNWMSILIPKWVFGQFIEPATAMLLSAGIGAGGNILGGLFGSSGSDNSASNFMNDHQMAQIAAKTEALQNLENYYKTGSLGQYQAGEDYDGPLGNYDLTDLQNISLEQLQGLLKGGLPDTYKQGRDALSSFVSEGYDPATSDLYKGFRTGALRERDEANDRMKRDLAVTGDLYSTENARQTGLLEERTQQAFQNKLAELADINVARKLNVAQQLSQLGFQEQDAAARNIGLGMSLGDIERQLKDTEAKDKYADYKRKRAEWYDTVDVAKQIAGGGVGVNQIPASTNTSPYASLINSGLELAGKGVTKYFTSLADTSTSTTNNGGTFLGNNYKLSDSKLMDEYLL